MRLESKTTKSLGLRSSCYHICDFTNRLTNGFANRRHARDCRKLKESYCKILAVFVLALLGMSVVAFLTWQSSSAGAIKIDGSFEDWQGVEKTTKARDASVPENIDLAEYAIAETGKNMAFYAKVYGNLLTGDGRYILEAPSENPVYVANARETAIPNANGRDVAYVFVDTDNNQETGFKPSQNFAVGADKAIEIVGKNGKIEASRVLTFAGVVQQEWNWHIGESVAAATNGKEMETMAGKNLLGVGDTYAVYFYMIDWQNKDCKIENALRCENARFSAMGLYLNLNTEQQVASSEMFPKGTPRAPISITSNSGFTSGNGVIGGDGTQNNPYIIGGWDINATGSAYGIFIANTDKYFIIQNCTVWGASSSLNEPYGASIAFKNVVNGGIDNCTMNNSIYGLWIHGSSNCTIKNSNIVNNTISAGSLGTLRRIGVFINASSNLTFIGNNITNNYASNTGGVASGYGIYMEFTNNTVFSGNTITKNYGAGNSISGSCNGYGVYLNASNNNIFEYNNISSNSAGATGSCEARGYGICISNSTGTKIRYNTINENEGSARGAGYCYGIYVGSGAPQTEIIGNNISSNSGSSSSTAWFYGIYILSSDARITDNTLFKNYGEIFSYGTGYSVGYGIYALASSSVFLNNTISENYATGRGSHGSMYGIHLSGNWNLISNNNISGNWGEAATTSGGNGYGYGLYLSSGTNNTIQNNTIRNNFGCAPTSTGGGSGEGYGLYLYNSNDNIIAGNIATGTYASGRSGSYAYSIYLHNSARNTIWMNNISSASGSYAVCAYLYSSNNNLISTNNVSQSQYGIVVSSSSNNIIVYNQIAQNTFHGVRVLTNSMENRICDNNFWKNNGATRGVTGNAQAYDVAGTNYWNASDATEGNYWSNWNGNDWGTANAYPLQGGAGAVDYYPVWIPVLPQIYIAGNENLTFLKNLFGWSGDGSVNSPITINRYFQNANALSAGTNYGIWLKDTSLYVRMNNLTIRNASFSLDFPAGSGVALENAANVLLTNSTITDCNFGVNIRNSQEITIAMNYVKGVATTGVYLYGATYVRIEDNTILENAANGISLFEGSNWNEIRNNTIKQNTFSGITLTNSDNNAVLYNNISQNALYGLHLYNSQYNTISANYMYKNEKEAVYLTAGSTRNTIIHNYFIENNGASRGVIAPCQAYDEVGGNYWYDNAAQEGNYWSNWDGNCWGSADAYPIDGGAGASDWYPMGPVPEDSSLLLLVLALACVLILARMQKTLKKS
ncbi:MAG: right-handed parallel beta-helix repeat-containing protein [Thermoplasmata archaeon]